MGEQEILQTRLATQYANRATNSILMYFQHAAVAGHGNFIEESPQGETMATLFNGDTLSLQRDQTGTRRTRATIDGVSVAITAVDRSNATEYSLGGLQMGERPYLSMDLAEPLGRAIRIRRSELRISINGPYAFKGAPKG